MQKSDAEPVTLEHIKDELNKVVTQYFKNVNPFSNKYKMWSSHGKSGRIRASMFIAEVMLSHDVNSILDIMRDLSSCTLSVNVESKLQEIFGIDEKTITPTSVRYAPPTPGAAAAAFKYAKRCNLHVEFFRKAVLIDDVSNELTASTLCER